MQVAFATGDDGEEGRDGAKRDAALALVAVLQQKKTGLSVLRGEEQDTCGSRGVPVPVNALPRCYSLVGVQTSCCDEFER